MKSVMITGGMGFLGIHIALKFIEEGYKPVLFDLVEKKWDLLEEKKGQFEFVQGDCVQDWRNVADTARKYKVEGIINPALPPFPMAKVNFDACFNLLEVCRLEGLKFVYISSNAAYGQRPEGKPMVETDFVPSPGEPTFLDEYGHMKVLCETLTAMYNAVHKVDSVSCRLSWIYGPCETFMFYPSWMLRRALLGKPAKLDEGGDFKTDYTYVKDGARGIYLAFTVRPLKHRLFNITSGRKVSVSECAEVVRKIVPGADVSVGPGPAKFGLGNPIAHGTQVGTMLVDRAVEELGYTTTPFEQGMRETAEWMKKQANLVALDSPN
jgi:UDP-glucuronate 4-epimerase